jgi:hypothetical protein
MMVRGGVRRGRAVRLPVRPVCRGDAGHRPGVRAVPPQHVLQRQRGDELCRKSRLLCRRSRLLCRRSRLLCRRSLLLRRRSLLLCRRCGSCVVEVCSCADGRGRSRSRARLLRAAGEAELVLGGDSPEAGEVARCLRGPAQRDQRPPRAARLRPVHDYCEAAVRCVRDCEAEGRRVVDCDTAHVVVDWVWMDGAHVPDQIPHKLVMRWYGKVHDRFQESVYWAIR